MRFLSFGSRGRLELSCGFLVLMTANRPQGSMESTVGGSSSLPHGSSPRPDHEEAVTIGLEKERCSGSFHLAVRFLVIKDDSISERPG